MFKLLSISCDTSTYPPNHTTSAGPCMFSLTSPPRSWFAPLEGCEILCPLLPTTKNHSLGEAFYYQWEGIVSLSCAREETGLQIHENSDTRNRQRGFGQGLHTCDWSLRPKKASSSISDRTHPPGLQKCHFITLCLNLFLAQKKPPRKRIWTIICLSSPTGLCIARD